MSYNPSNYGIGGNGCNFFFTTPFGTTDPNAVDNTSGGANSLAGMINSFGNTAVGSNTLVYFNGPTGRNTAFGASALQNLGTGGNYSTAIGCNSLPRNIDGQFNTAVGAGSLINSEYGTYNTAIGASTLYNMSAPVGANSRASGFGYANTALGCNAGEWDQIGSCNTYLGASSGPSETDYDDKIVYSQSTAVGYGTTFYPNGPFNDSSPSTTNPALPSGYSLVENQIVIGTPGATVIVPGSLYVLGTGTYGNTGPQGFTGKQGSNGVGTTGFTGPQGPQGFTGPSSGGGILGDNIVCNTLLATGTTGSIVCNTLEVKGQLRATSYYATSDYRIKKQVQSIADVIPELIIDKLKPVIYFNTKTQKQDMGFIAHELAEQFPFLVSGEKDCEGEQSVNYLGLIALLVKEVQELKKKL
jgi:hypothetical protein